MNEGSGRPAASIVVAAVTSSFSLALPDPYPAAWMLARTVEPLGSSATRNGPFLIRKLSRMVDSRNQGLTLVWTLMCSGAR